MTTFFFTYHSTYYPKTTKKKITRGTKQLVYEGRVLIKKQTNREAEDYEKNVDLSITVLLRNFGK